MKLNFKKIFLISLILLIIMMGVASAASTTDDLSISDQVSNPAEIAADDELSANQGDDVVAAGQQLDLDNYIEAPNSTEVKACQQYEFNVNLPSDATGNIASIVDGKLDDNYNLVDGAVNIPFKFNSFGLHNINLTYNGDASYDRTSKLYQFNVTDFKMGVTYPDDIYYGKESTLYVDLPKDVKGSLHLNLNDNFYHSVSSLSGDYEFPIYNLKYGENRFTIEYKGGNYHNDVVKGTFIAIPLIDIPIYAHYNEEYEITLILPSNATGSLVVNFDGNIRSSKMSNGKAAVSVGTIEDFDYHNITAYYNGNDYDVEPGYYVVQVAPVIEYSKIMWVEAENNISFKAPGPGTLKYFIDEDSTTTLNLTDGETTIDLTGLNVGDHSFYLDYRTDAEDYLYTVTKTFEVRSENPNIDLVLDFVNETRAFEPFDIITNIPSNGDGILYYYVDGEKPSYVVSWGFSNSAYIDPSELELGEHTVELQYRNDSYYKDVTKTTKFSVVDVKIVIPEAIDYNLSNGYVDVYITENVTGNITVYVDGKRLKTMPITPAYYGKDWLGYCYRLDLGDLEIGSHEIEVAYSGDTNHQSKTKAANVSVSNNTESQVSYGISMGIFKEYMEGNTYVSISLPSDAAGTLRAQLDNKSWYSQQVKNGFANITFGYLKPGQHNIFAYYIGNDYSVNGSEKSFEIVPCFKYKECGYDEPGYVYLELPSDAKGNMVVSVDGQLYTKSKLTNGKANVTLTLEEDWGHHVKVEYDGSDYYFSKDLYWYSPMLTWTSPEYKGENMSVRLPKDAKGNLSVWINGKTYYPDIINGYATFVPDNVAIGENEFYIFYSGDDTYGSYDDDGIFMVNAKATVGNQKVPLNYYSFYYQPEISYINITTSQNLIIDLGSDFDGEYVIAIGQDYYGSETFANGVANISLADAKLGFNEIYVDYEYQTGKHRSIYSFAFIKASPELNINVSSVVNAKKTAVEVEANKNLKNVTLTVNDVEHVVELVDGKGKLVLSGLTNGEYVIRAVLDETEEFLAQNVTEVFNVKIDSLIITAPDVYVGSDVNVTVGVGDSEGRVILSVNGVDYNLILADGEASILISDLPAGKYPISAKFVGVENYFGNANSTTVSVKKYSPELDVNVLSVVNAKKTIVYVTANKDIAKVSVAVNDVEYNVKLVNGSGKLKLEGLSDGEYVVTAMFDGNAKFSAQNVTKAFNVKIDPVIITAPNVYVGKDVNVTVGVGDSEGRVILSVNGVEYNLTLVDGKASVLISDLPAGEYDISAKFVGVENYFGNVNSSTVVVKKYSPKLSIGVVIASSGKTTVINVAANKAINGNVVIKVDGESHNVLLVNGSGKLTLSNLNVGEHSVSAVFNGNAKFLAQDATKAFQVYAVSIVPKVASVLYTGTYSVTVYGADGKIAANKDVIFRVNGKIVKKTQTDSNGVASFKLPTKYVPKKYTIKTTSLSNSISKKVTVKQIITAKATKFKKSGKKAVITATLKKVDGKYLKGKTVKLRFNGKTYKAVTSKKGVAKFTIKKVALKKLKAGSKYIYKVTYSKTYIKKAVKVKK